MLTAFWCNLFAVVLVLVVAPCVWHWWTKPSRRLDGR